MVTATGQASSAAVAGWRVQKVFKGSHLLDLVSIASSGARNAWLLGLVPNPEPTFVIQRWNGSGWVSVPLPARLRTVIGPWNLGSGIYTSSPRNAWYFPDLPYHAASEAQYAVWWNGTKWTQSKVTARQDLVLDAAVFSPHDVWAFGNTGNSPGYGPALVRRWNGTRWQTVPVPVGTPVTVEGVGPRDIWAVGVSKATVPDAHQTMIAMHWNGSTWSAPRLPVFRTVRKGFPWEATAIWASGPNDAWVTETPEINQQNGYAPPGLILLHWNGASWQTVARSRKISEASGLTPDGHGGFWMTSVNPANSNAGYIVDYRHGTFTTRPAPTLPGYVDAAFGITAVPGTGSFWAIGALVTRKNGPDESAILRYVP